MIILQRVQRVQGRGGKSRREGNRGEVEGEGNRGGGNRGGNRGARGSLPSGGEIWPRENDH